MNYVPVHVILGTPVDKTDNNLLTCITKATDTLTQAYLVLREKKPDEEFLEILYCKEHNLGFISLGHIILILNYDSMNKLASQWENLKSKYNLIDNKESDRNFERFMNNLMDSKDG